MRILVPGVSNHATADTVAVTIWGGAEGALTIIAASIPMLRALFRGDKGRPQPQFGTADERILDGTASLDTPGPSPRKVEREVFWRQSS